MNSSDMCQLESVELQKFSCVWGMEEFSQASYGGISPIFKDQQKNEWQLEYSATNTSSSTQKLEFTLHLRKLGTGIGKEDGALETMVSILIQSPIGKALGHEFCKTKIEEFMFTRDRKKYTRICFGKLRGNLQAILSGEKYLKLRCQIWAQKPIGVLGLETESDSLPAQLNALFLDTAFHDVTIRVADQKIPAHKVVLAARSDVFRAMFETQMIEYFGNQVRIEGFSEPVVRGMLEFIYTDSTKISLEYAEEWLRIADMYELKKLKTLVESVLIANLDVKNAIDAFRWSVLYKTTKLRTLAATFIKRNLDAVVSGSGIVDFAKSDPDGMVELVRSFTKS